jgi:hypothetical protein
MHRKWTLVSRFLVTTGLRCVSSVPENAEAISFDLLTPRLTRPGPDQLTQ